MKWLVLKCPGWTAREMDEIGIQHNVLGLNAFRVSWEIGSWDWWGSGPPKYFTRAAYNIVVCSHIYTMCIFVQKCGFKIEYIFVGRFSCSNNTCAICPRICNAQCTYMCKIEIRSIEHYVPVCRNFLYSNLEHSQQSMGCSLQSTLKVYVKLFPQKKGKQK